MKSINPTVWGPAGWHILHRMSFEFVTVEDAHRFIMSLTHILPCQKCRLNLKIHIDKLPIPHDVKDIPLWMWQLHNRVTHSIGKQTHLKSCRQPSFKRVENIYTLHKKQITEIISNESIFLLSVAETHPGARSVSKEYVDALFTFITKYVSSLFEDSDKIHIDKNKIRSRISFRELIKTICKSQNKTNGIVLFKECI